MGMISQYDRKLGETIRGLRKQANFTQEKLSEQVGISAKYLQYIESGTRQPSLRTVYKLARHLKVKVKDLFEF